MGATDAEATGSSEPPPGTLLVPLDAWQRVLDQLGNLHEAGQQLAEASARAARAETEAEFLRERVSDLRSQLAAAEAEKADSSDEEEVAHTEPTITSVVMRWARRAYHRLLHRPSP